MSLPEFIDTHVHLDAPDFDADREAVISRAQAAGVQRFICIGAGYGEASAQRAAKLAESNPCVWASVGRHPHDAKDTPNLEILSVLAQQQRVVAIGETGLDFHYDLAPRNSQLAWFEAQIELARSVRKPLIIHCREAATECLAALEKGLAQEVGGVFHCYSEDVRFAEKLRSINFMLSIPGIVTFKKSQALRDTVKEIPLTQIMLETDAPYLAPEPFRGKRCESSFMVRTAAVVAEAKGISVAELAAITTANAEKLFKLPPRNKA